MSDTAALPFRSLSAAELLQLPLPAPVPILEMSGQAGPRPFLTSKSLALLYGPRGIGKSHVALGIAWAAASGGSFLGWQAPAPRRVLYIDGEMAATDLRARLRLFGEQVPDTLSFQVADLHRRNEGLPDLADFNDVNTLIRQWGEKPTLLVLDNLTSLVTPRYAPRRRSIDVWGAVQRFLLHLRRSGTAALVVHHADKKGQQRGTSRHEDLLDLVLALRAPRDYAASDGARFEIHVEKARGLWGDAVAPIEARLARDMTGDPGGARWEWQPARRGDLDRVAALLRDGLNPNQIARELGISKSRSYRLRERVAGMESRTRSG